MSCHCPTTEEARQLDPGWYILSRTRLEVLATDQNDQVSVQTEGGGRFKLPGAFARKHLVRTWPPSVELARQDAPEDHRGGMRVVALVVTVMAALALWGIYALVTRVEWR